MATPAAQVSRALFLRAGLGCCASAWASTLWAAEGGAPVVVLSTSLAGPYGAALAGFQAAAGGAITVARLIDLSTAKAPDLEVARLRNPPLLVAFGQSAVRLAAEHAAEAPVICAMVMGTAMVRMETGGLRSKNVVSTLPLDLLSEKWLPRLAELFPEKRRIAILTASGGAPQVAEQFLAKAPRFGFTAQIAECPTQSELITTFERLKGRVDFVWCTPANLYINTTSIKPLVLSSIRNQLPIVGFSESFVRAGATCGFYADPADIGRRAAEMARAYLRGETPPPVEGPRVVRAALNETVCRLIGLHFNPSRAGREWLVTIR
jgi:ABC-type uncharacterized transport system substrate-binding protein